MSRVTCSRFSILAALLGLLAATLACSLGAAQPAAKPTVVITFPPAGTSFAVGQDVMVQSVAADPQGISRVELWVDGQLVHTQAVAPAATSYAASQPWKPAVIGSHIVEVRAYNVANATNDPVQVVVTVAEAVAEATPSPTAEPGAPAIETSTPTAVPPAAGTPLPPTPAYGGQPTIVTLIGLNVRSGPGTAYPVIGGLPAGQAARITGQNADGTWWQIVFPPDSGGRGWVSSGAQYGTAYNIESVPAVEAPLLPTYTPTSTPTSTPPPTYTPTNPPPVAQYDLYVRRMDFPSSNFVVGGTINLAIMIATDIGPSGGPYFPESYFRWRQGPTFPWHEEYCPANTHYANCTKNVSFSYAAPGNYTIEVEADSRGQIAETNEGNNLRGYTITIVGTPVTHATGALDIPQTYEADLDAGTIGSGGADIWFEAETATQRYVTPINGATIAKVGTGGISRDMCASASLSTARINVNDLPAGTYVCVHTNAGRVSGFRVNAAVGASPGTLKIGFTTWE